jgi:predicted O-linked N-acetylglucosamine transferase (SPINDLY family)
VDYYLSSALVEAPAAAKEYTEKLVLFDAFPCFERRPQPMPPSSRAAFGLPERGSLYLCPQRLAKFHPVQDELFRRILEEDSTGTMVMLAGDNAAVLGRLLERLRKTLGTAAERIAVRPTQSSLQLRQLMSVCDALLDIRHYSASLMAFDAFAAGLPIVTLPGQFKVERYALGFYRKLEIHDLVATTPDEYVRLAIRLGRDADLRYCIQERIRAASPRLFEDRQAVVEFERFAEEAKPRQPY